MEGEKQQQLQQQQQEQLKCPRCESENTKFCYYNNYNLSQPRHFCKDCRRYWTKGGTLRNIPVGGGTRKNSKRPAAAVADDDDGGSNPKRISAPDPAPDPTRLLKPEPISVIYPSIDHDSVFGMTGSFSSLLSSSWNFGGNLLDARHSFESGIGGFPPSREEIPFKPELQSSNDSSGSENPTPQLENLMGLQGDSSCWTGGWPDLSIYTPGSSFQ